MESSVPQIVFHFVGHDDGVRGGDRFVVGVVAVGVLELLFERLLLFVSLRDLHFLVEGGCAEMSF